MSNLDTAPSTLRPERELLRTRTHPKILFQPLALGALIIVAQVAAVIWVRFDTGVAGIDDWGQFVLQGALVVLLIGVSVIPFLRWRFSTFTVTTRAVTERWGVLYRRSRELPLNRIVSVTTDQGILDRIFRCGTLIFHDASVGQALSGPVNPLTARHGGENNIGVRFYDIPNIQQVRALIEQARDEQALVPEPASNR